MPHQFYRLVGIASSTLFWPLGVLHLLIASGLTLSQHRSQQLTATAEPPRAFWMQIKSLQQEVMHGDRIGRTNGQPIFCVQSDGGFRWL